MREIINLRACEKIITYEFRNCRFNDPIGKRIKSLPEKKKKSYKQMNLNQFSTNELDAMLNDKILAH